MEPDIKSTVLKIDGMTCLSCENRIAKKLKSTEGVTEVRVSWKDGTVQVSWDENLISLASIEKILHKLGYFVVNPEASSSPRQLNTVLATLIVLLAVYIILRATGLLGFFNIFPEAGAGIQYSMLLVIGLLTSMHCIGMCGGINLSQCLPSGEEKSALPVRAGLLYNGGRVVSYTLIGAAVGALGSVISFSGGAKGVIQLAAGVFMIIMGLNMLGIFPSLRRFTISLPKALTAKLDAGKNGKGPLYIGLLNGFMPCGPLQAMQLYALSTASPVKGAIAMFLFSLGTVPLMFGLSWLAGGLGRKYRRNILAAGSTLVIVLGFSMLMSGAALSGVGLPSGLASKMFISSVSLDTLSDGDMQVIVTQLSSWAYEPITVQAGKPVRWIIQADRGTVNGCNNRIIVPEYGIEQRLAPGENVIEFVPTKTGTFGFSCWMGMIRSSITVVSAS